MPWPLALACLIDDAGHERNRDGGESARLACRAHDAVMIAWWKLLPRSERRFNRRHLGAS
jgi:hypothetical protein